MHSFRTQLMNVMIAEQNTLVERIADNVDQKLLGAAAHPALSASEITEDRRRVLGRRATLP